MKAIVCTRYGAPEVLQPRDVRQPVLDDSEILVQTQATTVTAGDCRVRALNMPLGFGLIGRLALGFSKPRQPILGSELSGVVVAAGASATKFKVGDEVIVFTGTKLGCYSEFKKVSEDEGVVAKPRSLSFSEAAAIASSGTTALSFLRRGAVGNGSQVLVVGASGGVGSAAVMLAKHLGAIVTAVCSSNNLKFVASLGADRVIDYTNEDFAESGETYDAILDATGTVSYTRAKSCLKPRGRLLLVSASLPTLLSSTFGAALSGRKVVAGPAPWTVEDLRFLAQAVESGDFRAPVDRVFSLDQIIEAHAYVDTGRKKGNVVITMVPSS